MTMGFCAGIAHSFTGSVQECDTLLSFSNLFIGINGCSLKTAENLDVVKGIPLDRMMIETDSLYCEIKNTHAGINFVKTSWNSKKREKYDSQCIVKGRNEPCLVRQVLEVVAGCKGIADIEQLSKTVYHNTCRVVFPHDLMHFLLVIKLAFEDLLNLNNYIEWKIQVDIEFEFYA